MIEDELMNAAPTSVARLIVSVADLEPALVFYRDILGLDLTSRSGEFAWLDIAGTELMLHERTATPSDTAVAIGFLVEDVAAVVTRWRDIGGAIFDDPAPQPWGEVMAVVRDADGHVVCVSSI